MVRLIFSQSEHLMLTDREASPQFSNQVKLAEVEVMISF